MRTRLHIPPDVAAELRAEAALHHLNETGGVLVGHTTPTGIHVTHAIGPGPNARHHRTSFTPDSDWQAAQVADLWGTDNALEYLGDWHTHPNGTTTASPLDKRTIRSIAAAPQAQQPHPVMLILATSDHRPVTARAYQLLRRRIRTIGIADPAHATA